MLDYVTRNPIPVFKMSHFMFSSCEITYVYSLASNNNKEDPIHHRPVVVVVVVSCIAAVVDSAVVLAVL